MGTKKRGTEEADKLDWENSYSKHYQRVTASEDNWESLLVSKEEDGNFICVRSLLNLEDE